MHENRVDFTNTFRLFAYVNAQGDIKSNPLRDHFLNRDAFDAWIQTYLDRLRLETRSESERQQNILNTNPKYILRNYLAQEAITKAQQDDFSEVQKLLTILQDPFSEQTGNERYAVPPPRELEDLVLSCSS
jgi:uncharacterized protein YdiU (UPF0061 family)